MAVPRTDLPQQASKDFTKIINFEHPDFALTARTNNNGSVCHAFGILIIVAILGRDHLTSPILVQEERPLELII